MKMVRRGWNTEELVPKADLVLNLTPDKQHTEAVSSVMPFMKKAPLWLIHTASTLWKKA